MTYCKWLSQKTGHRYRLPTEAEWEYACRAGTTTRYFFGDDPAKLGVYAWFAGNSEDDNGELMPREVARKRPNPWGLYDMLGNVREWVLDFYSPTAYAENARSKPCLNPRGPAKGKYHVARGGDYDGEHEDLRCAARTHEEAWWAFEDPQEPKSRWYLPRRTFIGFRVAREIETK
ncbi:MAG: formylglycine-generating enzyme family protein [Planctomycetes bacterium]|nr:formylglycine-generating enzyme family protein [Planctomycetota bacterium]